MSNSVSITNMDGMEATTDLFINLIQNNRIIYDKSLKDFKNTRKKEEVWLRIANQSRMTVDGAKKRYASLRQKYSREKRNSEVKRRNKTAVSRNWVFYERLHFLDSFIQPRATYTNDRFVEEDDDTDTEMLDEVRTDNPNEADDGTRKIIDIEVEAGIRDDELEAISTDDTGIGFNASEQHQMSRNDENGTNHQKSDENISNCHEVFVSRIVSEYSGEETTEHHILTPVESLNSGNDATIGEVQKRSENYQRVDDAMDIDNYVSRHPCTSSSIRNTVITGDVDVQKKPSNGKQVDDESVLDIDNYVSSHRGTSSSIKTATVPNYPSRCYDPKTGEIIIARTATRPTMASNNDRANDVPKPTAHPSRVSQTLQSTTTSATTTARPNQSTKRSTLVPNIVPVASVLTSDASKENRIDAIRLRMENCLTAITNKVSDKAQKSPHGPFLSYLGTRLPSVPKERLPKLEREILELVDQHLL